MANLDYLKKIRARLLAGTAEKKQTNRQIMYCSARREGGAPKIAKFAFKRIE